MGNINYSSDTPISSKEEDLFSRWDFAKRISQIISERQDPNCIVIGLYGEWGSGKTTVLNFIYQALLKSESIITIRFNPWRYVSEETILLSFFEEIATALKEHLDTNEFRMRKILKQSLPGMLSALNAGDTGKAIASFIKSPMLDDYKKRIEGLLDKHRKRILILIDDIDRLDKDEIYTLFRIIKLTADFRYTAYILAFDKDVVSASLQDRYSNSNEKSGESFLEKIINIPLHLPRIEKKSLTNLLDTQIDSALSSSNITLSQNQKYELGRNYVNAFDQQITTPRKALQFGNILSFSLPLLGIEVNPVDLITIEGIRLFSPSLYKYIYSNEDDFTKYKKEITEEKTQKKNEEIKDNIAKALSKDSIISPEQFTLMLKDLFPLLQSIYGNILYSSDLVKSWEKDKRICTPMYFPRYFMYAISESDISDSTINKLIEYCNTKINNQDFDINDLNKKLSEDNAAVLISKLRSRVDEVTKTGAIKLADYIIQHTNLYSNPITFSSWTQPFHQAAVLISELISLLPHNLRADTSIRLLDNTQDLSFRLEVFGCIRSREKSLNDNEDTDKLIKDIGRILGKYIEAIYFNRNIDLTKTNPRELQHIAYVTSTFIDNLRFEEYIVNLLSSDNTAIIRLLNAFCPIGYSSEGASKSDFEMEQYNTLLRYIRPEIVLNALINLDKEYFILEDSYPTEYPLKDEKLVGKQFIWLHNAKEQKK